MSDTPRSLLLRARGGDQAAWGQVADLYLPLIAGWLRGIGCPLGEVDELTQEAVLGLLKGLPGFTHNGQPGAFRRWLRTLAVNRARDAWKARHGAAAGGGEFLARLQDLEDPDGDLARRWDREHDAYVVRCLLDLVAREFEPRTMRAFRRVALDGATGAEAAAELGMTAAAVYVARSRVLHRLRELAAGLID